MILRTVTLAGSALLLGFASLTGCTTAKTALPSANIVEYRLAPGDKIKLEVFREASLSGEYTVNDKGMIGLPVVGEIDAGGKTLGQLREDLTATLGREYVRNARVAVEIASFRPIYILGEVQKPGEYDYAEHMSVHALVAKAGGFTYRANENVVFIRHASDAAERPYRLTSGASVLPGDTVRIGQRYF